MESTSNPHKILSLIKEKPNRTIRETFEGINLSRAVLGVYLSTLKKKGYIINTEHGRYVLTPAGAKRLEIYNVLSNASVSSARLRNFTQLNHTETDPLDLENVEVILALKEKYGKAKLTKILDNIKRIVQ